MSRRGLPLVLVAALGMVVWTAAGAAGLAERHGTGAAASTAEQAVHLSGSSLAERTAVLVPAPHERSGSAARPQRSAAIVAALAGAALALRPSPATGSGNGGEPMWSGWFTDPGRLRGPPAV